MHKQMLKQKKGDIELSLNTILGTILAVIAILAILSIVAVIISIFYDSEKEEGTKNGFIEILFAIEGSKGNAATIKKSIYLGSGNVVVGFNPNPTQINISGKCGKPTLPDYTYTLSISRDLIKCPRGYSCLCLCKADHIGGFIPPSISTVSRFDYIDCQNAVCRPFMDITKAISFGNSLNCDMPILYSEGTVVVEISKDSAGRVTLKKE